MADKDPVLRTTTALTIVDVWADHMGGDRVTICRLLEAVESEAAAIALGHIEAIRAHLEPVKCAICGDYSAAGVEVHESCLNLLGRAALSIMQSGAVEGGSGDA